MNSFVFSEVGAAGGVVMLCTIIQRAEQLLPKEKTLYHRLSVFYRVLLSRTSCRITCLFVSCFTGTYAITNHPQPRRSCHKHAQIKSKTAIEDERDCEIFV